MLPACFVAGVVLGLPGCWLASWLGASYLAVVLLYAAVVLLASLASAVATRDAVILLWLPLVWMTIHAASGTGVLLELVRPLRTSGR